MKKINVVLSIILLSVMLVACGNNDKPVPFNNPTGRNLRPDCVFTVEVINSIPNTDMNLVTVIINCSGKKPSGEKINAISSKTKQLVIGQKVNVIIIRYQHNSVMIIQ